MRGQLSVEFVVVALLVGLIFSVSVYVAGQQSNTFNANKKLLDAKQIALRLARTANDVYLAGPGAQTKVFTPNEFDYNLAVNGRSLEVSFDNQFVDAPLVSSNVRVNSFTPGGFVSVARVDQNVVIG